MIVTDNESIAHEVNSQRDAGQFFEAWQALMPVFLDVKGEAGNRERLELRFRLWLQHFVGTFSDLSPGLRSQSSTLPQTHAAFLPWDVVRHAVASEQHRGELQSIDFEKWERACDALLPRIYRNDETVAQARFLLRGHFRLIESLRDCVSEAPDAHEQLSEHLAGAVRDYAAFWCGSRVAGTIGGDPPISPRLAEVGSTEWRAWVARSLDEVLAGIAAAMSRNSGTWSEPGLRIGIAMARHGLLWLAGQPLDTDRSRHTTILFVRHEQYGAFAHLHVNRHASANSSLPAIENVFYPDPVWLGMTVLDVDWLTGFQHAMEYASSTRDRPPGCCSWRLEFPVIDDRRLRPGADPDPFPLERSPTFTGGSGSAAAPRHWSRCVMTAHWMHPCASRRKSKVMVRLVR
jgi:hypothetical protein